MRAACLIVRACAALCAALAVPVAAAQDALVNQSAPDFALRAIEGANVRLSEHRGEVVVVTFWSSRCAPCSGQLASLERSLATYGSAGLTILGVNVDDDPERAVRFARGRSVGFPLLLDPAKAVSRSYRVQSLPTTVLIDRSGAVRHLHRDYSEAVETRFLQHLRALLNE